MNPRVLVIDDSEIVLEATREALEAEGFSVTVCDNPILAAAKLRSAHPDLLLLDVDMPAVKGPEVVSALRRNDVLQGTRVVLYSATTDQSRLSQLAAECGAVGSLPKSVRGPALAKALRDYAGFGGRSPRAEGKELRALVVSLNPRLETRLCELLAGLGFFAERRGPLGIDGALREGSHRAVLLEAAAYGDRLPAVVERLRRRGLLEGKRLVVLGPLAELRPNERSIPLDELSAASLRSALDLPPGLAHPASVGP